jgi:hypothetical protein
MLAFEDAPITVVSAFLKLTKRMRTVSLQAGNPLAK